LTSGFDVAIAADPAERIGHSADVVLAAVAPQRGADIACQRVAVSEADDLGGRLGKPDDRLARGRGRC